jgi:transcriptional regulator with XRE-family HTH domain
MAFAERLRLARARAGLSRAALAEAAGVSPRSIEEYEMGRVPPQALPAIARALEVSTVWLITGEQMIDKQLDEMVERLDRIDAKLDELLQRRDDEGPRASGGLR